VIIYKMRCVIVLALLITHTKERYRKQSKKTVDHESYNNRGQQDRQCTYNLTLRRGRATIVSIEIIKYCKF